MKPAVIYFINFFHVVVIKLRERKVAKRRLTLISPHFFPRPLYEIHGDREVALPLISHRAEINFRTESNATIFRQVLRILIIASARKRA